VTESVKAAVPGAAGNYSFMHQGKAYALPPASECATKIEAGVLMDAMLEGGDTAQLKLGLAMLVAADVSGETMTALRSMTMGDFGKHLTAWMTKAGVRPGESDSSSS
jgi:hypothetical protein